MKYENRDLGVIFFVTLAGDHKGPVLVREETVPMFLQQNAYGCHERLFLNQIFMEQSDKNKASSSIYFTLCSLDKNTLGKGSL